MHRSTWTWACATCLGSTLLLALAGSADQGLPSSARLAAPDWAAVDAFIQSRRAAAQIPGIALVVVQGDQVIYRRGYGQADDSGRAVTPQTPFVLGSVSKAFTALAVMQLVEAGKVELDAPVQRYLPWFRVADQSASAEITVRQLLNHTSGMSIYAGRRLLADPDGSAGALERHVRALADVPLAHRPGTEYEYSNANYTTAGLIVQTVSGISYEEYVQEHIFEPLGMHDSFARQEEAERGGLAEGHRFLFGRPVAAHIPFTRGEAPAAYLCSSADDMAHWLIAQLNDGRYGGKSVLSPAGMAALHTPPPGGWYAMGWAQSSVGDLSVLMHLGEVANYRAQSLLAPSARLGVAVMMNVNTYLDKDQLVGLPNGVVAILVGKQPPAPAASIMPLIFSALGFVAAAQAGFLSWSLWFLRRWQKSPERIPQSSGVRSAYLLVPFALDAALAVAVFGIVPAQFQISLSGMYLYQPDVAGLALALGTFSAIWGTTRTLLFLRCWWRPI